MDGIFYVSAEAPPHLELTDFHQVVDFREFFFEKVVRCHRFHRVFSVGWNFSEKMLSEERLQKKKLESFCDFLILSECVLIFIS